MPCSKRKDIAVPDLGAKGLGGFAGSLWWYRRRGSGGYGGRSMTGTLLRAYPASRAVQAANWPPACDSLLGSPGWGGEVKSPRRVGGRRADLARPVSFEIGRTSWAALVIRQGFARARNRTQSR